MHRASTIRVGGNNELENHLRFQFSRRLRVNITGHIYSPSTIRIARNPSVAETMPLIGTTQQIASSTCFLVMP